MKKTKTIKWGVIGTGNISHQFANALSVIDDAEIVSVLSRTPENAAKFATEYNIPYSEHDINTFLSLEIDIVYVGIPHNYHKEAVLECIKAGKNVLCEKPMGLNASEVKQMVDAAKAQNVFLMEAMWSHFFPAMEKLRELLLENTIGEVRLIKSDFCFRGDWNPTGRHLNKDLAGGALLDLGVYNIYFSQFVMNETPVKITGDAYIGSTGVDEQCAFTLKYKEGQLAISTCSLRTETLQDAYIYGTDGYIHIPKFWQPDAIILHKNNTETKFEFTRFGNGYTYEILSAHACLNDQKKENPIITLEKSLDVIQIMDELRAQWNLSYPSEQ